MGVLSWIIVGLIAGWLAAKLTDRQGAGLLGNLAIGLIGAIVGGLIAGALGLRIGSGFWAELIVATLGAMLVLFIFSRLRRS